MNRNQCSPSIGMGVHDAPEYATMCKDESGQKYFTDKGCPKESVDRQRVVVQAGNTFSARESIDINRLNAYERRNKTNTKWQWVKKK
ncbi:MAG: hypothetical protein HOM11_15465 [Methylococcales bacterium]|jgi:hypothetical protein|nr:hypothetical protein [Methylococcales bacterium]MBT7442617.1 hypothetical protein [Methylococcales bacterium]